jgi:hypothetical protein
MFRKSYSGGLNAYRKTDSAGGTGQLGRLEPEQNLEGKDLVQQAGKLYF